MVREPKYGHLRELHKSIKLCEKALVSADPTVTSLGSMQEVCFLSNSYNRSNKMLQSLTNYRPLLIYTSTLYFQAHTFQSESGGCAAFLANYNTKSFARVMFNNKHYNLPPWSISILPDCTNVVFNTAKVTQQSAVKLTCM